MGYHRPFLELIYRDEGLGQLLPKSSSYNPSAIFEWVPVLFCLAQVGVISHPKFSF